MKKKIFAILAFSFVVSGCSITTYQSPSAEMDSEAKQAKENEKPHPRREYRAFLEEEAKNNGELRDAYEKGVRDTMEDFKGRMRAKSNFTWEPPVVETIDMPAAVKNGALYPRHKEPVIIKNGRWIENNGVALPEPR